MQAISVQTPNTEELNTLMIQRIGKQNTHLIHMAGRVYSAALRLADDGYTILSMHVRGRMPVIAVEPDRRLDRLRGATAITVRKNQTLGVMMTAEYQGVELRWIKRGVA